MSFFVQLVVIVCIRLCRVIYYVSYGQGLCEACAVVMAVLCRVWLLVAEHIFGEGFVVGFSTRVGYVYVSRLLVLSIQRC